MIAFLCYLLIHCILLVSLFTIYRFSFLYSGYFSSSYSFQILNMFDEVVNIFDIVKKIDFD